VAASWAPAGSLKSGYLPSTATKLADGRVLVAGGLEGLGDLPSTSAEIFDSNVLSWTDTGSLSVGRSEHFAIALANGWTVYQPDGNHAGR